MPEKIRRKQDGRFKPGVSGNPKGRPRGARNKATVLAESLIDGQAEALVGKLLEMALAGDVTALRVAVERLLPPAKDRPINADAIKLPSLKPSNLAEASAVIVRAVASGRLTPSEGQALANMLEGHRKTIELVEIERRLAAVEQNMEDRK